jgi:ubiquinone/menaquinone biosynthesis C-methylase UbiE
MQRSSRVDYDSIADRYDATPHREKSVDPELAAFLAGRASSESLALLDIACGTGNQLVANSPTAPHSRMIGLDGSLGMLRQARSKSRDIGWVHGDSAVLPFASGAFDFASCQYAFHHFRDKAGMVHEVFRVLRSGGRLALYNMCPHESRDWLYYDYFPDALARDLADFWPPDAIVSEVHSAGFSDVTIERQHRRSDRDLAALLAQVRQRGNNSQLLTLSDAAYEAGLDRIEQELGDPNAPRARPDHLCFVTVRGDKPAKIG